MFATTSKLNGIVGCKRKEEKKKSSKACHSSVLLSSTLLRLLTVEDSSALLFPLEKVSSRASAAFCSTCKFPASRCTPISHLQKISHANMRTNEKTTIIRAIQTSIGKLNDVSQWVYPFMWLHKQ